MEINSYFISNLNLMIDKGLLYRRDYFEFQYKSIILVLFLEFKNDKIAAIKLCHSSKLENEICPNCHANPRSSTYCHLKLNDLYSLTEFIIHQPEVRFLSSYSRQKWKEFKSRERLDFF